MVRIFMAALIGLVLGAQPGGAQSRPEARTLERAIEAWLAPLVESRDFSGVIMIRHGEAEPIALTFGYVDWVSGAPMSAAAAFPAGSITKSLTTAMVHRLVTERRLSLDDPVNRYIPELTGYSDVRLGAVLTHTAGLDRDIPPGALADASSSALVSWLDGQAAPGPGPHDYANSNIGYALLAVVIERVTNARFETLLTTEFLIPLGMQDSRIVRAGPATGMRVPAGYAAGPLPLDLRAPMPDRPALGASGLVAPTRDLLRLADAVRTRRVDLFEPDGSLTGSWSVLQLAGETIYSIEGSVPGYSVGISVLPGRDITFAYGTNIESYPNWGLRDVLHALALNQTLPPAAIRPRTDRLTEAHLDAVGTYSGSPFGPLIIRPTEGGLELVMTERDWIFYLTPTGPDALNWRLFNTDFAYERDEAGRVAAITARETGLGESPRLWRIERTDLPPLPAITTEAAEN